MSDNLNLLHPAPKPNLKLMIDNGAAPLVEIEPDTLAPGSTLEEVELPEEVRQSLGSWLQRVPELLSSGVQATTATYTIRLDPEALVKVKEGTWRLVESSSGGVRGTVVDAQGVIRAQASFDPNTAIRVVSSIAAVWHLLATVTAQKYLHSINDQLADIHRKLSDIKNYLEQREFAALLGNARYLQTVCAALGVNDLEQFMSGNQGGEFEAIQRQVAQIELALQQDLAFVAQAMSEWQVGGNPWMRALWVKPAALAEPFQLIEHYEFKSKVYLTALSVSAVAAQVSSSSSIQYELAEARLAHISKEVGLWRADTDRFYLEVESRAEELAGRFRSQHDPFLEQVHNSKVRVDAFAQPLLDALQVARSAIPLSAQTTAASSTLYVELNRDGSIKRAWKQSELPTERVKARSEGVVDNHLWSKW